jgi:hypothetical protein
MRSACILKELKSNARRETCMHIVTLDLITASSTVGTRKNLKFYEEPTAFALTHSLTKAWMRRYAEISCRVL